MDHNVDGRVLMPATSYVVTAWEAAAAAAEKPVAEFPAAFEDVAIHQAVVATHGQKVTLARAARAGRQVLRAWPCTPTLKSPDRAIVCTRRSRWPCSWRRPCKFCVRMRCSTCMRACSCSGYCANACKGMPEVRWHCLASMATAVSAAAAALCRRLQDRPAAV